MLEFIQSNNNEFIQKQRDYYTILQAMNQENDNKLHMIAQNIIKRCNEYDSKIIDLHNNETENIVNHYILINKTRRQAEEQILYQRKVKAEELNKEIELYNHKIIQLLLEEPKVHFSIPQTIEENQNTQIKFSHIKNERNISSSHENLLSQSSRKTRIRQQNSEIRPSTSFTQRLNTEGSKKRQKSHRKAKQ